MFILIINKEVLDEPTPENMDRVVAISDMQLFDAFYNPRWLELCKLLKREGGKMLHSSCIEINGCQFTFKIRPSKLIDINLIQTDEYRNVIEWLRLGATVPNFEVILKPFLKP